MKNIFINHELCIGCRHCEIACAVEHSQSKNLFEMLNEVPQSRPRIHIEVGVDFLTFPNRCRHCDPAPCIQVCPTDALYRDNETGNVLIAYDKCINCGACAVACPFGIITFHNVPQISFGREVNAKCDGCNERVLEGKEPACVDACKTGALIFGDINQLIRNSRKDFTIRMISSQGADVETSKIPKTVKQYREILKKIAEIGPLPNS
jgi:carbon-monoxide dehydrogenase iron sulfur subunit